MSILQTLLLAARWHRLYTLCLFTWASFHPSFHVEHPKPNAVALASAIADAALFDPDPVFGDAEHEAAVAAAYAVRESWLVSNAVGDSGAAHGFFQLHSNAGRGTPTEQTAGWLHLLHDGAVICTASPAAPLSGGCNSARKLANRRVKAAFEALDSFFRKESEDASAGPQETPAVAAGGASPAHAEATISAGGSNPTL
jgi:hypothetical protein